MTLSTSVTNPIKQRLKKTILWYTLISAFFFVGSRIYEHFSFGETSAFMHYLFLIPLIGGALLVASTVDGERLLSTESQSLEFRSGYPHSRSPLPRDCQPLWSIYYNGSTLLLPWSCLSSTSSDQPLLCPQCLGGENSLRHQKRPFLKRTDVF